ncbi:MAG: transposase [Chloroflexaceae bacterium]|nr:transposase [Chloroflexaceae bacterium]
MASLEELIQVAGMNGIAISAMGIGKRMNETGALFLRMMLEYTSRTIIAADPVVIPLLDRFTKVLIQDSTTMTLPSELVDVWRGCGGSETSSQSSIKVQLQMDLRTGAYEMLTLHDGREHDCTNRSSIDHIPAGALRIADLGYFRLADFTAIGNQGAY